MIGKLALKTKKIRELANLKLKDVFLEFFHKLNTSQIINHYLVIISP